MKLKCPACGTECGLDAWHQPDIKVFMELLIQIPHPVLRLAPAYLALFRPAKTGLTWRKAYKILSELNDLIRLGTIHVQGSAAIPCRKEKWAEGMQKMLDQDYAIKRPLQNHNYLRKVVYPLAESDAAHAEKKRNRPQVHREDGGNPAGSRIDQAGNEFMSADEASREIKKFLHSIGRGGEQKEHESMAKKINPKSFFILRILEKGIHQREAVVSEFVEIVGEEHVHPNDFGLSCKDLAQKGLITYDRDLEEIHITENGRIILRNVTAGKEGA
ncbi:hypothetical protein [Nitrospina gracilis]|uniref:hypothetical protein n=1 Tax=Nitrospina gracilis TaxID=35801 RepID=UPI001F3F60EE|nr:hypothetical protein [Nitrospina gracilis]MCF8719244.1 hypothetical protein [Nitrospina gracilis Nb-211]